MTVQSWTSENVSWDVSPAETTQPYLNILTQGQRAVLTDTLHGASPNNGSTKKHDHKIVQELRNLVASEA